MTSLYTVSREDIYDYRRCPKIVAIKAYRAIRAKREDHARQPRHFEPVTIGMIGEAAVALGFQGVPRSDAVERIARMIPQLRVSQYLQEIAVDSLKGVEEVRGDLAKEYGNITIIGKGEGRHPDCAGTVRPDFIAFSARNSAPIIVETKNSTKASPSDSFQAMFYNGIAEGYGVYILEERFEGKVPEFSPRLIRREAETVLIYPRLSRHSIVREKFVPSGHMVKEIWKAKELGFKGLAPETNCGEKCAHRRLKVSLPEGDMEPIPPLPLIFSEGILESGYNLDVDYQASYGWNLLPSKAKLSILFSKQRGLNGLDELRNWLMKKGGIGEEAAEIVLDPEKREAFLSSRPVAQGLIKSMRNELEPWEEILRKRLGISAPSILGKATAVYSLPRRSFKFVKEAWKRWH